MYTFANTLLTKLAACEHVTVTADEHDSDIYVVEVDLGTGYNNVDWEGGYWADTVRITDERLKLHVLVLGGDAHCWDDDEEYCFGEGTVALHYADYGSGQLAYTSALEEAINEAVHARTNGILACNGSEQGMQGYDAADECYLSLDVAEVEEETVLA
jgi:hypothetical protein